MISTVIEDVNSPTEGGKFYALVCLQLANVIYIDLVRIFLGIVRTLTTPPSPLVVISLVGLSIIDCIVK